jgi:hypothetical protein
MTMQQITNRAAALGFTPDQMNLLMAAMEAGMNAGRQDAAVTLADNDELPAAEFLAANYGFDIA